MALVNGFTEEQLDELNGTYYAMRYGEGEDDWDYLTVNRDGTITAKVSYGHWDNENARLDYDRLNVIREYLAAEINAIDALLCQDEEEMIQQGLERMVTAGLPMVRDEEGYIVWEPESNSNRFAYPHIDIPAAQFLSAVADVDGGADCGRI